MNSCKYCKADCAMRGEENFKECKGYITMSNADRIRSMSDEELASYMIFFCPTDTVFKGTGTYEKPHYTGLDGNYYSSSAELAAANLEFLQQPVKEIR